MQWIPSKKMTEQHDATFDGQVTEIYIIDGHALPPSAIRKALAQPEQEPDDLTNVRYKANYRYETKWQSLTDDEIKEIIGSYAGPIKGYTRELFDKIEAKLREKNT